MRRSIAAPSGKKNAGKPSGGASPFLPARSHQSKVPSSVERRTRPLGIDVADEPPASAEPRVALEALGERLDRPGQADRRRRRARAAARAGPRARRGCGRRGRGWCPARALGPFRPAGARSLDGVVLGAVVDDEHLVHRQLGQPVEHDLESLPAVPRRDHRRHAGALGFRGALGPHDKQVYVRTMSALCAALPPLALAFHGVSDVPLRRDPHGLFVSPGRAAPPHHEAPGVGLPARRLRRAGAARLAAGAPTATPRSPSTTASWTTSRRSCRCCARRRRPRPCSSSRAGSASRTPGRAVDADRDSRRAARAGSEPSRSARTRPSTTTSRRSPTRTPEPISRPASARSRPSSGRSRPPPTRSGGRAPTTIRACRDAGFAAACRTSGEGSWDDPHNLPRQDMLNRSSALGLRLKRDDLYEPLMRFAPARAARQASRVAEERWRVDHRTPGRPRLPRRRFRRRRGDPQPPAHVARAPRSPTSGCSRRAATAFVAASELPATSGPAPGTAALTFDDGWRNWLTRGAAGAAQPRRARRPSSSAPGSSGGQHPDVAGEAGALSATRPEPASCTMPGWSSARTPSRHPDLRGARRRRARARAARFEAGDRGADRRAVPHASPIRTASTTSGWCSAARRGRLRARVRLAARALAPARGAAAARAPAARRAAALAQAARRAEAGAVSVRFSVVIPTKGRPEPLRPDAREPAGDDPRPDEVLVIDADEHVLGARDVVVEPAGRHPADPLHPHRAEPDQAAQHRDRPGDRRRRGLPRRRRLAAERPVRQAGAGVRRSVRRRGDRLGGRAAQGAARRAALAGCAGSPLPGSRRSTGAASRATATRATSCAGDGPCDVEFMPGCFMSARRELASTVRFDEHLGAYALAEDEDFSYRLSRRGRLVYLPDLVVVHEKLGFRSFDSRDFGKLVVRNRSLPLPEELPADAALRGCSSACCCAMLVGHRLLNREWRGALGVLEGTLRPRARAAALSVRVALRLAVRDPGWRRALPVAVARRARPRVDRADHVSRRRSAGGRAARSAATRVEVVPTGAGPVSIARSALRLRRELRQLRPDVVHGDGIKGALVSTLARGGDADPGRLAQVRLQPRRLARARRRPPLRLDRRRQPRGDRDVPGRRAREDDGRAARAARPRRRPGGRPGRGARAGRRPGPRARASSGGSTRTRATARSWPCCRGCASASTCGRSSSARTTRLTRATASSSPARSQAAGLADAVALPGFRANAVELIAGCDVLVIPSVTSRGGLGKEGFSLVALEAMGVGTPGRRVRLRRAARGARRVRAARAAGRPRRAGRGAAARARGRSPARAAGRVRPPPRARAVLAFSDDRGDGERATARRPQRDRRRRPGRRARASGCVG